MSSKNVLVIVPAFNEEANINKTVSEMKQLNSSLCVVVIDDGSTDNTLSVAKESGVFVVSLPFNLGIGGAVQTGFKFARDRDFDIVIQVDGDAQHDVAYLKKLIEPIIEDKADMTIGSRFLPPYLGYRSSVVRRIGIHFFAHLISFLTDYQVTDPTSGFRGFNRKMINIFADYYPHDFPEPEAIAVASRYGMRVQEVPVKMRKRNAGHSSIRYLKTLYYMCKVTFAILLDKLKSTKDGKE